MATNYEVDSRDDEGHFCGQYADTLSEIVYYQECCGPFCQHCVDGGKTYVAVGGLYVCAADVDWEEINDY